MLFAESLVLLHLMATDRDQHVVIFQLLTWLVHWPLQLVLGDIRAVDLLHWAFEIAVRRCKYFGVGEQTRFLNVVLISFLVWANNRGLGAYLKLRATHQIYLSQFDCINGIKSV